MAAVARAAAELILLVRSQPWLVLPTLRNMAEHADETTRQDPATGRTGRGGDAGTDQETTSASHKRRREFDMAKVRARTVGVLAAVVRWVGLLFALILAAHVVLVIGEANPENWITSTIGGWADPLAIGFKELFVIEDDAKLQVLVNYGIAAIFWMVVSSIAARLIRRLGGPAA